MLRRNKRKLQATINTQNKMAKLKKVKQKVKELEQAIHEYNQTQLEYEFELKEANNEVR